MYIDWTYSYNDLVKFLSWCHSDQISENEHQIVIPPLGELNEKYDLKELKNNPNYITPKISALKEQLVYKTKFEQRSIQYAFLNYQFEKYSGEKIDFIDFMEWFVRTCNPYTKSFSLLPEQRVLDWTQDKRKEVNGTTLTGQATAPANEKKFTHPQQMLLLKKLGIIKYLDKYNLTAEKKAELISKIIGRNWQNTREYLGTMDTNKDTVNNVKNNDLINKLYTDLGIS